MIIRKLTRDDAEQVYSALTKCFSSTWSFNSIKELLLSEAACLTGAFEDGELIGYAVLERILDEGSLTNIAVAEDRRRQGIGEKLLCDLIDRARSQSLSFITLEVRASNTPAISLYRKYSFETVGRRPHYYHDPKEDAELMTLFLKN